MTGRARWAVFLVCGLAAGCSSAPSAAPSTVQPSTSEATTTTTVPRPSSTIPASTTTTTTTTTPRAIVYVFPFTGKNVSYGHRHAGYPATDVFGCGATVVAPIGGTIDQTRTFDPWDPKVNDPATRGGKYVSLRGNDGVRYYFAHLDSVAVSPGEVVEGGTTLGIMGQTGDARSTVCHTHVGISWPCSRDEWAVRRGEVWPWKYLDAWRKGTQLSPADEVVATEAAHPNACNAAVLDPSAADA